MTTLAEIRARYPQYDDMSDEELAQGLHRKFYPDIPIETFSQRIGLMNQQRDRAAMTHWQGGSDRRDMRTIPEMAGRLWDQTIEGATDVFNSFRRFDPNFIPSEMMDGAYQPPGVEDALNVAGVVTLGAGAFPAAAGEARMGIKAYHGSPHDFDEFRLADDTIGTGEGAQAFGHGLYFAEKEGVARSYRDSLGAKKGHLTLGVDDLSDTGAAEFKNRLSVRQRKMDEDYIKRVADYEKLKNERPWLHDPAKPLVSQDEMAATIRSQVLSEMRREFKEDFWKPGTFGHMYEVDINAAPEDFLDWDKPLSEQGAKVRDTLHRLGRDPDAALNRVTDDMRGGDFVREYPQAIATAKKKIGLVAERQAEAEATQRLREAGIPGIRYLDRGSRSAGEGTHNYVLFRDDIIDILRKYGWAGLAPAGVAATEFASGLQAPDDQAFNPN